ncbi:type II secretion system F family protein [Sphingomonas sp. KC8]|uniref:type II secretion system F family protein n=1 Tax=Sphingomonas sp. KC8 TaxID=1030157 RepID=UPI00024897FA|nr:type II secretion system F family protein [Sphingomonas sp. KC8]ARS27824.1 Flp pilus assembly protein TadB [Sphingomonas sp. KC8]
METTQLIVFAAAVTGMLLLAVAAFSGPSSNKAQARRLAQLRDRHDKGGANAVEAQMRRILAQRETKLDLAFNRFIPNPALLQKRLDMTGKNWTVGKYAVTSLVIAALVGAVLASQDLPLLLALLVGLALGLGIPHMLIGMQIGRRVAQFTAKFPDAIELLVRGLRSGLPISETMGVVASEVPGPVGVEFRAVADKMKIGRTMDAALQETADRLGTPEFQFFTITLQIQRETGGNLAETLANLAEVLRKRAQMKLKIKAMSSESKASAYIIGALPFIVFALISYINFEYMGKFFTDERLIIAGCGGLVWMAIGAFIMRQMINFEI